MNLLQGMEVFRAVIDHGTLSAAARQLNISAPSATRLLAELEAHVGARLLQRTTRQITLTAVGEGYLQDVRAILENIDQAHAALQGDTTKTRGTLRVGCDPSLAEFWLAPLYMDFRASYPRIDLDIHVETHPHANLGQHDIALIATREWVDSSIIARRLYASDGIICASPDYLERSGTPFEPQDLANHNCLLRHSEVSRRGGLQFWRKGSDCRGQPHFEGHLRPALSINHTGSLLQMALSGAGLAAFTHNMVSVHLKEGRLVHVLPEWITGRFVVLAAVPSQRYLPARSLAFLEFLSRHGRMQEEVRAEN